MKFASKLNAEPGWKIALARSDGSIYYADLKEWGVSYNENSLQLIPLDILTGEDVRKRRNFLMLINPNINYDLEKLKVNALSKAKEPGFSDT